MVYDAFLSRVSENRAYDRYVRSPIGEVALNTLVGIYIKWSAAFDMYDPRITRLRPRVVGRADANTSDTPAERSSSNLVNLREARDGVQVVEDAHHKLREGYTAYDSLTFLIQHCCDARYVWWKCASGHTFYTRVRNMMLGNNPVCDVCVKSLDIRLTYEAVANLKREKEVSFLTVEFPLVRKRRVVDDRPSGEGRKGSYARSRVKPVSRNSRVEDDEDDQSDDASDDDTDDELLENSDLIRKQDRNTTTSTPVMHYDIFFCLGGTKLCAIEFDDSSHYRGSHRETATTGWVKLISGPPKGIRPHPDSVKNVIASCMGVHLLRIHAFERRGDAVARVDRMVRYFVENVENNDVSMLPFPRQPMMPFTELFDHLLRRHETYDGMGPLHARDLVHYRDHRVPNKHKKALRQEMPVSIFLSTDLNDGKDGHPDKGQYDGKMTDFIKEMAKYALKRHPALRNERDVHLRSYMDPEAYKMNAYLLWAWSEPRRRTRNPDYVVRDGKYNGRVMYYTDKSSCLDLLSSVRRTLGKKLVVEYRPLETTVLQWEPKHKTLAQSSFEDRRGGQDIRAVRLMPSSEARPIAEHATYPDENALLWKSHETRLAGKRPYNRYSSPTKSSVRVPSSWKVGWATIGSEVYYKPDDEVEFIRIKITQIEEALLQRLFYVGYQDDTDVLRWIYPEGFVHVKRSLEPNSETLQMAVDNMETSRLRQRTGLRRNGS